MKKILLPGILFFSFHFVHAQIDPLYALYLNNPLTINPAYTGSTNNFNASVAYRKQWAGFVGSPSTVNVTAHTSLASNKMGLGMVLIQDQIGANKNTEIHMTYAYKLLFGSKTLAFGLQAGMVNFRSNNEDLNPFDNQDPAFNTNQNFTKPSLGAGVILKSDRFFLGVSVPRMLKNRVSINEIQTDLYEQHFYGMAAYIFHLSERLRLKPSILARAVQGSPLSIDYNISVNLDEKYTLGIFARNANTCGFLTQFRFLEAYRLAYTFEVPLDNSVGTRFTTHELTLGFAIPMFQFHDTTISSF